MLDGIDNFSRRGKADAEKWKSFAANIGFLVSDIGEDKTYEDMGACIKKAEAGMEDANLASSITLL